MSSQLHELSLCSKRYLSNLQAQVLSPSTAEPTVSQQPPRNTTPCISVSPATADANEN